MKRRKGPGFVLLLLFTFSALCAFVLSANDRQLGSKMIKLCAENYYPGEASSFSPYQHAIVRQKIHFQEAAMPILTPAAARKVMKKVSISRKEAKNKSTGAVQSLFLTIHNGSHYLIEQVQVEIAFISKSGKSLESRIISVDRLKPSASSFIQVPYCKQGMNVKYKIMNIYMPSQIPLQKLA